MKLLFIWLIWLTNKALMTALEHILVMTSWENLHHIKGITSLFRNWSTNAVIYWISTYKIQLLRNYLLWIWTNSMNDSEFGHVSRANNLKLWIKLKPSIMGATGNLKTKNPKLAHSQEKKPEKFKQYNSFRLKEVWCLKSYSNHLSFFMIIFS